MMKSNKITIDTNINSSKRNSPTKLSPNSKSYDKNNHKLSNDEYTLLQRGI